MTDTPYCFRQYAKEISYVVIYLQRCKRNSLLAIFIDSCRRSIEWFKKFTIAEAHFVTVATFDRPSNSVKEWKAKTDVAFCVFARVRTPSTNVDGVQKPSTVVDDV